jgi:hypothetical protein
MTTAGSFHQGMPYARAAGNADVNHCGPVCLLASTYIAVDMADRGHWTRSYRDQPSAANSLAEGYGSAVTAVP